MQPYSGSSAAPNSHSLYPRPSSTTVQYPYCPDTHRAQPPVSRSTTYLASLGSNPPPPSAPPFPSHSSDSVLHPATSSQTRDRTVSYQGAPTTYASASMSPIHFPHPSPAFRSPYPPYPPSPPAPPPPPPPQQAYTQSPPALSPSMPPSGPAHPSYLTPLSRASTVSYPPQPHAQNGSNLYRNPSSPYGSAQVPMPSPFAIGSRTDRGGSGSYTPTPPLGAAHASPPSAYMGPQARRSLEEREREQIARAHRDSALLEESRQTRLAEEEQRRLAYSLEASAQDRLRTDALAEQRRLAEEAALREALATSRDEEERERREKVRRRVEEEREVQRAIAVSRGEKKGKGKGKARAEESDEGAESEESEWERRDREAVEMAMRLSLQDGQNGGTWRGYGRTETSAEAFERFSRPSQAAAAPSVLAPTPAPQPLFAGAAAAAPLSSSSAALSTSAPAAPSAAGRSSAPDDLPPAYDFPPHAPENDEPGDIVIGPGRPLPPQPQPQPSTSFLSSTASISRPTPSSSAPHPPPGAALAHYHAPTPPSRSSSVLSSMSSYPFPASVSPAPAPSIAQHPLFNSFEASSLRPPSMSSSSASSSPGQAMSSSGASFAPSAVASAGSFDESEEEGAGDADEVRERDPFGDEFSALEAGDAGRRTPSPLSPGGEETARASPKPKDLFGTIWRRRAFSNASTQAESPGSAASPPGSAVPPLAVIVDTDTRPSTGPTSSSPDEITPVAETGSSIPSPITATTTALSFWSPLVSPPPTASTLPASTSSAASPSLPTSATTNLTSPALSLSSLHTVPSFGGYLDAPSPGNLAPFATQDVLDSIKWGFVDPLRAAMHPPLEYAGDFPRGAQLSGEKDREGKEGYRCFAVEAKGWQALLVYLMWHGNSRLEAAPADLALDKSNRGLQASLGLDFFRSFADSSPRVRITLTLLPLSPPTGATPLSASSSASPYLAIPLDKPEFDPDCPSIRLNLPAPLTLPMPLSTLASTLSRAHTASRQSLRVLSSGAVGGVSLSSSSAGSALSEHAALARSVDLLRQLHGEHVGQDEAEGRGALGRVEDAEVGLMDRMKARLRRRGKVRVLESGGGVGGGAQGPAAGGPLPEGAMLITPFALD
ncbi:hypothetical protein JCM11641_003055 [Rhodosporidiobolus odoratus]